MTTTKRIALVALLANLAGCFETQLVCDGVSHPVKDQIVALTSFPRAHITMQFAYGVEAHRSVSIVLLDASLPETPDVCQELSADVTASIGDVTVPAADLGGLRCDSEGRATCTPPQFELDPGATHDPNALIAITDGDTTFAFLRFDAFVERTATPIEAPDYVFHRGQTVTFRWSAPEDLMDGDFRWFRGELRSAGEGRIALTCELVDPDGIRCQMPSEHLTVGLSRTIALEVGLETSMSPTTYSVDYLVQHEMTFADP